LFSLLTWRERGRPIKRGRGRKVSTGDRPFQTTEVEVVVWKTRTRKINGGKSKLFATPPHGAAILFPTSF